MILYILRVYDARKLSDFIHLFGYVKCLLRCHNRAFIQIVDYTFAEMDYLFLKAVYAKKPVNKL